MLLNVLNYVIVYLYDICGLVIEYSGWNVFRIFNCSSNAVFADDSEICKSSDGYLFQLYGGVINWRAEKQKTITILSTEAELLSLFSAGQEMLWWSWFFKVIQFDSQQSVKIHCDNIQTIWILTKEATKLNIKLRHIDIHQHWLHQEVQ